MSDHDEKGGVEHAEHDFTGPLSPPVARLIRVFLVICVGLFAADFFVHRHTEAPLEGLPGFYPVYGFVGCVILVLAAKELRKVVMRPEDYYDPEPQGREDDGGGGAR